MSEKGDKIHIYAKIYAFAASVGAFEGYVYKKESAAALGMKRLSVWVDNIVAAYDHLPDEARREFQDSCDRTVGRAVHSLTPVLGEDHELVGKLKSMVKGSMPASADDFNKKKWFQK
jgi:hypothetical protein